MDAITIRCKKCQHAMKFAAAKVGKKTKCPKCETIFTIEADAPPPAPAPAPAPPPPAPPDPAPKAPAPADAPGLSFDVDDEIKLADIGAVAAQPAAPPPPKPAEPTEPEEEIKLAEAPVTAPAVEEPKSSKYSMGDEGDAAYGVFTDPELEERRKKLAEEEEAAKKQKKKKNKQDLPDVTRKIKAIADADSWAMVRLGMLAVFAGVWVWLACHLLQGGYVLLGSVEFPEYASLIGRNLEARGDEELPPVGRGWDVDELQIYLGMVTGRDFLTFAHVCLTIASLLYFVQAILWALGYACCLPVPRRFGMFGIVLVLLGLAIFNMLMMLIFKLLPVTGVHGYVLVPYVVPEIVLTEYNMERMVPIHILWSGSPFWENVLNLVLKFLFYLEPTMLSIFVWYAGTAIKDETVEQGGMGRVQMSLGTFFILVAFHLLSLAGASPPLVYLLRVLYALWYFFLIIYMLQLAMLLLKFRAVLEDKIHPKNELIEEEPVKKKKKKK